MAGIVLLTSLHGYAKDLLIGEFVPASQLDIWKAYSQRITMA